jgi:Fuc2NAc and GlcNAc transferase
MIHIGVFLLLSVAAFTGCLFLTRRILLYARRKAVIDIPGERSSHTIPTARGGGLAVVLVFLAGALLTLLLAPEHGRQLLILCLATGAMAGLGWADDHADLAPVARLVVQFLIAGAIVYFLGPLRVVELGGLGLELSWLAWPVSLLWLVWMTNLYNFMDGIDGIAAVEGLVAAGTMGLWFAWFDQPHLALLCLVLAGALSGFLVWNWSPARIFMGDVGSLTLGLLFAVLAMAGVELGMPLGPFLLLLAVFIADATLTLLKRIARRERLSQAHRGHYYQRATRLGWSHARVSTAVFALNLLLAGLATLELLDTAPAWIWPGAAALVLAGFAGMIELRERRWANRIPENS